MRGKRRTLRTFMVPQGFIVLASILLLFNALRPDMSLYGAVRDSAYQLVVPAPAYAAPRVITASKVIPQLERHVDCSARPCLVLSFDDGPNPVTTPKILDTLESKHVRASFFVIGSKVEGNDTLLRRMAVDGMEVGNHSWSHHDMRTLTPEQIKDELSRTQEVIAQTGIPKPSLFRPPYGAINDDVVKGVGLQTALWNEDPEDWQASDVFALADQIVADARPGGVVDLHDIHQVTVDALPSVIDRLQAEGYQFVTVSELLHSRDRPGDAPFYGYHEEL